MNRNHFNYIFPAALLLGFSALKSTQADNPTIKIESEEAVSPTPNRKPGLTIESRIDTGAWKRTKAIYPLKSQSVTLRIRQKKAANIKWYLIFADLTKRYNNANPPGTPNSYKWRGIEKIGYFRTEIEAARGQQVFTVTDEIPPLIKQIKAWLTKKGLAYESAYYQATVGTFWLCATADIGKKPMRTVGIEEVGEKGISPKVFRLSIREQAGYLGWVSSLYNVPGVFGSIRYQSRNYIGADCADLLMTAWSKWKRRSLTKNYNVQMLLTKFRQVATFKMVQGTPDTPIAWQTKVHPGDMMAVRYGDTGRKFHHIGALYKDDNKNGMLDDADLILHAGPEPLHLSKFNEGAFDGHIIVLRP